MKPPLPLEGSSRRRAYARSTVWSRSEKSDMERIRTWGSVRRAQRASGDGGEDTVVRAQVSEGPVVIALVNEGAVVRPHATDGAVWKAHIT